MNFQEALQEITTIRQEYISQCTSLPLDKIQYYRDKLSDLAATLSVYRADFFEDHVGSVVRRKIAFARECDRIMSADGKKVAKNVAELKATLFCESLMLEEAQNEALLNRARFVVEQVDQILNSIASRMSSMNKVGR